jgi:TolB-like protein
MSIIKVSTEKKMRLPVKLIQIKEGLFWSRCFNASLEDFFQKA